MRKYFILLVFVTFFMSCSKVEKPTVVTLDVMQITETSAMCSGNVESDGGADVTAKGVCWAKTQNPTTENDIPDVISRFHNLAGEDGRSRKDQSFLVPVEEIREKDYAKIF